MDLLGESLPGRTSREIANLIHTYKQRGKRQISQQESPSPAPIPPPPSAPSSSSSSSTSTSKSSNEQQQQQQSNSNSFCSSSRPICAKNSPISQWSQLLGHIIHPRNKRDDLSETLISVLEGYSNNSQVNHANNNINNVNESEEDRKYSSIYEFVSDCLQGKCPRELNPQNSLIILSLLKQAKLLLHYVGCDVERKFLQNSKKNTFRQSKEPEGQLTFTSEVSELHESETLTSQLPCSSSASASESSSFSSTSASLPSSSSSIASSCKAIECHLSDPVTERSLRLRLGHFVESCMDLPKVKKIKSCLNPLNVAVSMTVEEANCLLEAIEDSS